MKPAALDLGEHGITVNAVIPGLIDTELTRNEVRYAQAPLEGGERRRPGEGRGGRAEGAGEEDTAGRALGGAGGRGAGVVFLASSEARMVSGAAVDATGGGSAHNAA